MTKPYRPCNGSEGEWFENRFCYQCERDRAYREDRGDSCPIFGSALAFGIGDEHYPAEWVEDDDGSNPRCTAFEPEQNAYWIVQAPKGEAA